MNCILLVFVRLLPILLVVLFLAAPVNADQTDPRLDRLFDKLRQAEVFSIAHATEQRIWAIWHERPDQPAVAETMAHGLRAMRESALDAALDAFDTAVGLAPDFAEAWNKRATVHFLLGDYPASIADIRRTLELEPRHFGALSGLGLINLRLDRKVEALEAFEAALEVHPFLQERFRIRALRDEIAGEKI
jgi:tetratricopeptide (TPR) repeat protein